MSVYDIDYSITGPQLLPPDKRRTRMLAWIKALLSPLQYLQLLVFTSYKQGSTAPQYAAGAYNKGDRVVYFFSVYESLVAANTSVPTTPGYWVKVQDNFIGVDERVKYSGAKLVLEYALNKWFVTQFRQPPAQSDIYITVNQIVLNGFIIGATEARSSKIGITGSSEYIGSTSISAAGSNMDIHMPLAVFNALASTNAQRDSIVRAFVNKYVTAGIIYSVLTY
jgi:hypothetical protein